MWKINDCNQEIDFAFEFHKNRGAVFCGADYLKYVGAEFSSDD
jgi:hypothetical protein